MIIVVVMVCCDGDLYLPARDSRILEGMLIGKALTHFKGRKSTLYQRSRNLNIARVVR